jgi:effector-binding domain-containing protein
MPDPKMELEEKNTAAMNLLYIKTSAKSYGDISKNLASAYAEMGIFSKDLGLKLTGAPMAFYSGSGFPMQIEAAMPVNKLPPATKGSINTRQLMESRAVIVHFWGPYELTSKAYDKIKEWMQTNKKEANGAPYEVYIGDPGTIKDPYQVQTDIIQPIK